MFQHAISKIKGMIKFQFLLLKRNVYFTTDNHHLYFFIAFLKYCSQLIHAELIESLNSCVYLVSSCNIVMLVPN